MENKKERKTQNMHEGETKEKFLIPSSFYSHLPAYEEGTDRVF